jgi:hypothetical protein
MKKQIIVTVRGIEKKEFYATRPGIRYKGNGMNLTGKSCWTGVRQHFPKTPDTPYRVTYTISERGILFVDRVNGYPGVRFKDEKPRDGMIVCFLPESWIGLRAFRRVKRITP